MLWRKKKGGRGRGEKKIGRHFLFSLPTPSPAPFDLHPFPPLLWSFNTSLSRAKTFTRPKKMSALQANKTDTQKLETDKIGHFRVPPGLCIKTRLSACSAFEMIFHSHANKTHFHMKGCALGLILKVRVFGTWKCPSIIEGLQA